MTDKEGQGPEADRIREEAAGWIARTAGRASPRALRKLERWRAADPRHDVAYQRMAQRFDGARMLRRSQRFTDRPAPAARRVRPTIAFAAFAVAILALVFFVPKFSQLRSDPAPGQDRPALAVTKAPDAAPRRRFSAPGVAISSIGLEDGSVVTLDTGSAIDVAFTGRARRLTLLRGRARFDVAHDGRSFTVFAGGGSVTARGTIFDVSLKRQGQVDVALLRGKIDVVRVPPARTTALMLTRHLVAGEGVRYSDAALEAPHGLAQTYDPLWSDNAVEFDNVSLGYLVERSNRGAGAPITISEPTLAKLRVSGHFDVANHEHLAQNLATLFGLRVALRADAIELER